MKRFNNNSNSANNNNLSSKISNNNQIQTHHDKLQLIVGSKQINNLTKNNFIQSKRRAVSTEREDLNSKKPGRKIESYRSKSNLIENPLYNEEYSNTGLVKSQIFEIKIKQKPQINNVNKEVCYPKYLDNNVSEEFQTILKKYLEMNANANKQALLLNLKNLELKKKIEEKFIEKKISVYEIQILNEYSENVLDSREQLKRRKLMELEEKEKELSSKKLNNEKILKLREYFNNEIGKQAKLQEDYSSQLKECEFKVIK